MKRLGLLAALLIAAGHDHSMSFFCKLRGCGFANPRIGSGNDTNFLIHEVSFE